ncbi:rlb1 [Haematobia irritans]|uniref:rlb1 n=1 Tax=Haematobia irritans TaxID=7368 RepID=UPI003F500D8B
MLNKLQFNNMVISNKKGIQQARIQTINKLVHKIRKLKTLLDKRPNDTKCKERINKSTETMEQLKKFKRVEIMKSVLLLEKPPAAVITNGLSTPEEMAVALLAMNKVMLGLTKRFRMELKLEDSQNNTWRDELRESSKRRKKIERTEEKKRKRLEMKEQKIVARKRQEWMEQNCENVNKDESKDGPISTVGEWKIEDIPEKDDQPKKKCQTKPTEETSHDLKLQIKCRKNQTVHNENKEKKKTCAGQRKKIDTTQNAHLKENVHSEDDEPEKRNSIVKEETIYLPQDIDSEQENEDIAEETHVVDPFFVTETGENYLSSAVSSRILEDNESVEGEKNFHMAKLNGHANHKDFRERRKDRDTGTYFQQRNSHNDNHFSRHDKRVGEKQSRMQNKSRNDRSFPKQESWNNNIKRKGERDVQGQDEKLHPSWAAKQKLKPVITNFQGKKIRFDNDEGHQASGNRGTALNTTKNTPTPKPNTESLHPSWLAKQKLKPVITAFQGKKISFDDE